MKGLRVLPNFLLVLSPWWKSGMQTVSLRTPYLRARYGFNIGHIHTYSTGERGVAMETPVVKQEAGGGHGLETARLSSVHLLEEFVSGVFIAVILHLIELPLLGGQHGVDLLGERQREQGMKHLKWSIGTFIRCWSKTNMLAYSRRCSLYKKYYNWIKWFVNSYFYFMFLNS